MSENQLSLLSKINEISKECIYMQETGTSNVGSFVTADEILTKIKPKMHELGLLLVPMFHHEQTKVTEVMTKQKSGDKQEYIVSSPLTYKFVCIHSKEEYEVPFYMVGKQGDPAKALGSGLTYAERYFLVNFFNIVSGDKDYDTFIKSNGINLNPADEEQMKEVMELINNPKSETTELAICSNYKVETLTELSTDKVRQIIGLLTKRINEA